jgi:hypothetical protein
MDCSDDQRTRRRAARWRAAGDLFEATVLYLIALDYIQLGEQLKALDYATQALPIAQASHVPWPKPGLSIPDWPSM